MIDATLAQYVVINQTTDTIVKSFMKRETAANAAKSFAANYIGETFVMLKAQSSYKAEVVVDACAIAQGDSDDV